MVHKNVDQSENLAVKNRHMETGSLLQEQELQSLASESRQVHFVMLG